MNSNIFKMAEDRARAKLPPGIFDTLPNIVKETMIATEQEAIDLEEQYQQEREELERFREEERKRLEKEEEDRVYLEQKARELARDQEMLRRSGIADRIGEPSISHAPTRMNKTEVDHIDISCEFIDNEEEPVGLIPNVIQGFRKKTIENMVPQMEEIWRRANAHQDVQRSASGYMMFHLWTGNKRQAGTRAVSVASGVAENLPYLWDALDQLIDDINKVKAGYSHLFKGEISYMHFYFKANYYPNPKSVINWGVDIRPIERREYFNIFTASDNKINCVVQCGQRLFGSEFNGKCIDDIIKIAKQHNKSICIMKPHTSIRHLSDITEYKDLVIEANSPVKKFTHIQTNTIYLLHYDAHLGIIEDMREPKKHIHYTQFRPMTQYPKCHKITMIFDIECYFDPDKNTKHIPYLACACFIYSEKGKPDRPGNVIEFEGKDCIAQMIEYAVLNVNEFNGIKDIELVAHNGGGYDFHYILTSMYDPSVVKNIIMRNNNFISFQFKHQHVTFHVKDSMNFIPFSLKKAAESFLGIDDHKTDFPHHEVKSQEDLQRVFNEWIKIDESVHMDIDKEKEKMFITINHYMDYNESKEAKKLIDWARMYCTNDVIVLAKVWIKFKESVHDVFGCEIVNQTITLAGLSFRLFEAHLPSYMEGMGHSQSVKLYHPNKKDFMNMRKSLVGGRCISINGVYSNVSALDVKSLYPAAMAYYDQPYGQYRNVTEEVPDELGIYYCRVEPAAVNKGHGFFPLKHGNEMVYTHTLEPFERWYTSVDMEIGRLEGHKITAIPYDDKEYVGYSWKHKGKIFKNYIEGVLYKLKLMYEREKNKQKREVIKIIMNSLWGKFAQKWMDHAFSIRLEENCDMEKDECYLIFDTNYFLVKSKVEKIIGSKPVQNGVFTLSWARYHMYHLWKKIAHPNALCIYSDTDSMFVETKHINKDSVFTLDGQIMPVIGKKMGQLEIEHVFDDLICVGKKQYIGRYWDDEKGEIAYKKRFKGVPLNYVKPELYAHLIKSPTKTAQIKFLKFKREYGCVHGYYEKKTVTQTE